MKSDGADEQRLMDEVVTVAGLAGVRAHVQDLARQSGLDDDQAAELALAVHEAAANAVRHGGGSGEVTVVQDDERRLIIEIRDDGPGLPPWVTVQLPAPEELGGRGLWLVQQLTDHVEVDASRQGTTIRLEMGLSGPS